jgi:hypothetical protein
MRTKYLLAGFGLLLVAAGCWVGRVAWRVKHQLVTLDVYEVALNDVLRKIEKQTWSKVRAEKSLDARITLRVTDKPLSNVLDRIAGQAGAHWSTVYAVYDSSPALHALDAALQSDGKLEPAGWSKIAPNPPPLEPPGADGPGRLLRPNPGPGGPGPMDGQPRMMLARRTPNGPVMFFGGPGGQMELWSPEELVVETALNARLGSDPGPTATAQAAAESARKVGGQWTTYFAFRKSAMGIGFGAPPRPGSDPLKRTPNERFARLTPEQRVQRARERLQPK